MARKRLADRRRRQRKYQARQRRLVQQRSLAGKRRKAPAAPAMATKATASKGSSQAALTTEVGGATTKATKVTRPAKKTAPKSTAVTREFPHKPVTAKDKTTHETTAAAPAAAVAATKLDPATPLADLGLPDDLFSLLDAAGITSVGQFDRWSKGALSALGIKQNMIALLEERVHGAGYAFKSDRVRKVRQ